MAALVEVMMDQNGSPTYGEQLAGLPVNFYSSNVNSCQARRNSCDSTASIQGSAAIDEEYNFVEISHPAQVLTGLNHLRVNGHFCDVTLCVDGQEFFCHKIVLASFSSYFNAMFTGNLAESAQDRVTLNDIEAPVMELLVSYAYTSEIVINRQNVQALLSASNLLEILPVKEACSQYLEQNMDEANSIGIHCFAEAHACADLERKSKRYILDHFTPVSLQEEYLQLSLEKLTDFLKDDDLSVDSEEQVFHSAMRWLDYNSESRKPDFDKVLETIRLPLMTPYFLFDIVEKQEVVRASQKCRALVDEAKTYLLLEDRRPELQTTRTQLRKSSGEHRKVQSLYNTPPYSRF